MEGWFPPRYQYLVDHKIKSPIITYQTYDIIIKEAKQQVMSQGLFLKILCIKFLWISMKTYKVLKLNGIIYLRLQMTYFKDVITNVRYKF